MNIEKIIRHKLKNRNNHIICKNFLTRFCLIFSGISVSFHGKNNTIYIEDTKPFQNCKITIVGDNNSISISDSKYSIKDLIIDLRRGNNRKISIGSDFSCESCHIILIEDNSSLTIGNDCMFSHNIIIRNTDSHDVYTNNEISNTGPKHITIGNHVWIGINSILLKNVSISDNSIVGAAAVVCKHFHTPSVAIGGNPAKKIKENINWDRKLSSHSR